MEHLSQPSDSSGDRPTSGGRWAGGARPGRSSPTPVPVGCAGGHCLAHDSSRRPIKNETNSKEKKLFRPFPHWTTAKGHGLPTRTVSGNHSPPSRVRFPRALPAPPRGRRPSPLIPRPRPQVLRPPNPGRLAVSPGLEEAGRPLTRPGGAGRAPGSPRTRDEREVAPGRPPPRPRRHSAPALDPPPRRGFRGGARPGPLPAGLDSGAPQPTVATALPPRRGPVSRVPSPFSALRVLLSRARSSRRCPSGPRRAEPSLRPPPPAVSPAPRRSRAVARRTWWWL